MEFIYWVGGVLLVLLGIRVVRVALALREVRGLERRLAKEGVDAVGTYDGLGIDAGMRRQDGCMPCRLIVAWTHPETGQKFALRSSWFWYTGGDENDKARFANIPIRVVLSNPAELYSIDLSGFGVELFRPKLRWWK